MLFHASSHIFFSQVQTWMNVSRLREETSILKNIKQREIIEMKKKENQVG